MAEDNPHMELQPIKTLGAKQTRVLKLLLDAVMLVLLVLMYKKQVVSLAFHEIGGLALIGLFAIHHLFNAKWIDTATKRLFARDTPGLVRARYLVDALLLAAFLVVGVTGILISKVLFTVHVAGNFSALHSFASALAILLIGVHLGLHADDLFGKLFQKGANRLAKAALAITLSALIAFGGYSLFTTSFLRHLAAPLQTARISRGNLMPSGEIALDGSMQERPSDLSELPEAPEGGSAMRSGREQNQGQHQGGAQSLGEGGGGSGATGAMLLIAQYVGIIALFGAVTFGVFKLVGRRKKPLQGGDAVEGVNPAPGEAQ